MKGFCQPNVESTWMAGMAGPFFDSQQVAKEVVGSTYKERVVKTIKKYFNHQPPASISRVD